MSEQEVARLQDLLARVQRNAAAPRATASSPFAAAPLAAAPAYVPPAPAYVAPAAAYVAPAPVYEPPPPAYEPPAPVYEAPAPLYEPEPPAVHQENTGYTPEPVPAAASLDASVDDLLLEDPFPSVPPPVPPSYSEVLEDPIPLVSVTSARSHDEDISGVMVVSELSEEQPEELLEDDIVEMTGESPPPPRTRWTS